MKCQDARWEIITASGLLPPLFDLPSRVPDIFKAFYFALESDFPLDLTGMESQGSTRYSDLKLVLDVEGGKIHCELSPAILLNHFQLTGKDALPRIKKFGRLYEAAVRRVFPDMVISDRVYRLHAWVNLEEGGKEAAVRLLSARGGKALGLRGELFKDMEKDFTIRADLKGKQQNVSYMLQKSAIEVGHLYIETAVQFLGGTDRSDPDANYEELLKRFAEIKQELGFDA